MSNNSEQSRPFLAWLIFVVAFTVFQLGARYSLQSLFIKTYDWVYPVNEKASLWKELGALAALYLVLILIYQITKYLIKLCPQPKIGAILYLTINIGIIAFSYLGGVQKNFGPVWLFSTVLAYSVLTISLAMTVALQFYKTEKQKV